MLTSNRPRRVLLAAVLTASALALACSSASAIRLALGEPTFRAVWTPARFTFSGITIGCNVTLEGSFHSTSIAKVERALIGFISRASVNSCTAGTMSVLTETLPWHVQYGSFGGTLPNISTLTTRIVGMSASWTFIGLTCLGRTEANTPAQLIAERSGGTIASYRWDEAAPIPLTGSSGCSSIRGRLGGTTSSATGLGNARAVALTLIG